MSAIEWIAVLVDDFGFQHSEILRMPWVTFMAYQRLATVRRVNKTTRDLFNRRDMRR